jgi:hypothetical protein
MVELKKIWYNNKNGKKTTFVVYEFNNGLKVYENQMELRGHIEDHNKLIKIIEKIGVYYGIK